MIAFTKFSMEKVKSYDEKNLYIDFRARCVIFPISIHSVVCKHICNIYILKARLNSYRMNIFTKFSIEKLRSYDGENIILYAFL